RAKFGIGPATEHGFFYDIALEEPITAMDFPRIESRVDALRAAALPFEKQVVPIDDAIALMQSRGQSLKVELLALLKTHGATKLAREAGDASLADPAGGLAMATLYRTGEFLDMCRGPHVEHSGLIGPIKLRSIAGAYWRGDAANPQLQRIHAFCFRTHAELDAAIHQAEQATLRDHRKLGRELRLFAFSQEVGLGLPLWLPNGTVLRDELEQLARTEEYREGYQRVITPHLAKHTLYRRSGHLAHYAEDMYAPLDIEGEAYYLRPMNCPHHHELFLQRKWSYRNLPVRYSEYGQVYRYEASGALSGLMRTRGFCQNDAHIYCRTDQAKDEFVRVMRLHARYYELFGIRDYWMRLSLPDLSNLKKYVDAPEGWLRALEILRDAMRESGLPYTEVEGEAAFYGPKVDFMIKSVVGTQYAISTNQLDFVSGERFGMSYTGSDGEEHPVYVIHRAPLGSHERFVAFLCEHFGGVFPTWLAPEQVKVIPIAERHNDYAVQVCDQLRRTSVASAQGGIRAVVDLGDERMQKKIRNAQIEKVPYLIVVGDRDQRDNVVSVRRRGGDAVNTLTVHELGELLRVEIASRCG
ncbi:MAG TPA: threonine--tRNA ligase, partial [Steroidobacteraceae bacterium]|nr:threonine--tRNA ligase [Steroidobacteraceae bacterium]